MIVTKPTPPRRSERQYLFRFPSPRRLDPRGDHRRHDQREPCSRAGELQDADVGRDVDVPNPVGRDAIGAGTTPRREEGAARVELLDAAVEVICDVDVPAPVGPHAGGSVELAGARAEAPPGGEERAG